MTWSIHINGRLEYDGFESEAQAEAFIRTALDVPTETVTITPTPLAPSRIARRRRAEAWTQR